MDLLKFTYSKIAVVFNVFEWKVPFTYTEVPIWSYEGTTIIVDNYLLSEDGESFLCEDGTGLKVE